MTDVSMSELRAHLKDYLDRLQEGEEIGIIRNSAVIGRLVPADEVKAIAEAKRLLVPDFVKLSDGRQVRFRQYGVYEDPGPIQQLHRRALEAVGAYVDDPKLDSDLAAPGSYYQGWDGEFWVGELEGQIVAMGAFRLYLQGEDSGSSLRQAELKRMRIEPDLQGKGIGSALLKLLESRAKQCAYAALVLDTVVGAPAQQFYDRHGYQETSRHQGEKLELVYYKKEL